MPKTFESPGDLLYRTWRRLRAVPGGGWLFSVFVGWLVPYTGTLRCRVRELYPGYARIELQDRRRVRNHLNSIHAVALANLGEFTAGLAMLTALPPTVRGIVTDLSVEYLKKARGRLVAESEADPPAADDETRYIARAEIKDANGDVVARVAATWSLRPGI